MSDKINSSPRKYQLIYVAGAYSGQTFEEVDLNVECAKKVGQVCVKKGWYPVIPHANTAGFDRTAPGIPYEFWIGATLELMRRCDAVILCPGWELSKGARGEYEEAQRLGLPVYKETFWLPDLGITQLTTVEPKEGVARRFAAWAVHDPVEKKAVDTNSQGQ